MPVCEIQIKLPSHEKFEPLATALQRELRKYFTSGKAIYHLGHYFWVVPCGDRDYAIY